MFEKLPWKRKDTLQDTPQPPLPVNPEDEYEVDVKVTINPDWQGPSDYNYKYKGRVWISQHGRHITGFQTKGKTTAGVERDLTQRAAEWVATQREKANPEVTHKKLRF